MAQRFSVSIPDSMLAEHGELLTKISLSLLLQEAIKREARQPEISLPAFIAEAI